jgi:hypothetical protein
MSSRGRRSRAKGRWDSSQQRGAWSASQEGGEQVAYMYGQQQHSEGGRHTAAALPPPTCSGEATLPVPMAHTGS